MSRSTLELLQDGYFELEHLLLAIDALDLDGDMLRSDDVAARVDLTYTPRKATPKNQNDART